MLPLMLMGLYAQRNYINGLAENYQEIINHDAYELSVRLDAEWSRVNEAVFRFVNNEELDALYAPDRPVAVGMLRDTLADLCKQMEWTGEIVLFDAQNEYLFSSTSSYTLDNFLKYRRIAGLESAQEFRGLLMNASKWTFLPSVRQGKAQLLLLYPCHSLGSSVRVLLFSLDSAGLHRALEQGLKNNGGRAAMLDSSGSVLLEVGASEKDEFFAAHSSAAAPFSYALHITSGDFVNSLKTLHTFWYMILFIMLGLVLLEVMLLSSLAIRPLRALRRQFAAPEENQEDSDYTVLSNSIEEAQKNLQYLQKCFQATQTYLVDGLLCGETNVRSLSQRLIGMYAMPVKIACWQAVCIAPRPMLCYSDLLDHLRGILPAGATPLLREPRSDGCLALLLAYSEGMEAFPRHLSELLQSDPFIANFSMSETLRRSDELPLACAQTALALAYGAEMPMPENHNHPEDGFSARLDAIASAEKADQMMDCLREYAEIALADQQNSVQHKLNALRMLIECQRRLQRQALPGACPGMTSLLGNIHAPLNQWLEMWMTETAPLAGRLTAGEEEPAVPLIDKMRLYLQDQCKNPDFTLQQMAQAFAMTPAALNSFFKAQIGCTVSQYLSGAKMAIAKELLKNTDTPIYEIGLRLGYYGPNSFIRRFKQITGMTPGGYRDECMLRSPD